MDGPPLHVAGPHGRLHRRHRAVDARAPGRLSLRHHVRHEQRVRLRLPARQHGGHAYAIIDEVDSILIDEARTPLIISGAVGSESDEKYAQFNTQVVQLVRKQTAIVNDLIARAEPRIGDAKTAYDGAVLLYQAQLGMPKNKKLLKLLQEPGVKTQVQRVELDVLADRKLPAR